MRTVAIQGHPDAAWRRRRFATVVAALLVVVACGDADDDGAASGDTVSEVAERSDAESAGEEDAGADADAADDPAGAEADPADDGPAGGDGPVTFADHLAVGECFDDQFDDEGDYDYSRQPPVVPCTSAHDNEVIAIADLSGEPGAPYPGDEELDAFFEGVCTPAFDELAGEISPLAYFVVYPLEDQWAAGGRSSVCAVFLPDARLGAPVAELDPVVPVSFPTGLPLPDGIVVSSVSSTEDSYAPADSFLEDTGIDASGWLGVTFEGGEVAAVKAELEAELSASEWGVVDEYQWRGDVETAYYALDRDGERAIVEIWQLEGGDSRLHYFYPPA